MCLDPSIQVFLGPAHPSTCGGMDGVENGNELRGACVLHLDLDCFYAQVEIDRLGLDPAHPTAVQQWESLIAVNYPGTCRATPPPYDRRPAHGGHVQLASAASRATSAPAKPRPSARS